MGDIGIFWLSILFSCYAFNCKLEPKKDTTVTTMIAPGTTENVVPGADRLSLYLPALENKRVGLVVNHTSMVGQRHLVDTLLSFGIDVKKIFAPEHGFRGTASAGAKISDGVDDATGLPILSLYGKTRKPSLDMLANLDIIVFDIQDVGARFYTYISTLALVMEACAEAGIPVMMLDRPNPNAHYVDGPVLKSEYASFVGMHPVPVVYGMTIGEYAMMVNGEGWLDNNLSCALEVIPCKNYTHDTYYNPPIAPSPNLKDMQSILLYPSLCFFEGTIVSEGRGTETPFRLYGHPNFNDKSFSFTPVRREGALYPKLENQTCYGRDLRHLTKEALWDKKEINLDYITDAYHNMPSEKDDFFLNNGFFEKLAGTSDLREQITLGKSTNDIKASWEIDLINFKKIREKYMLYP